MAKIWLEKEDEFLKNNIGKISLRTIANELGIDFNTVKKRAIKLGLDTSIRTDWWSNEDIDILKNNYQNKSLQEISKMLNKTPNAVSKMAKKLNIKLISKLNPWTNEKIDYLKNNYNNITIKEMTKVLKISRKQILLKMKELNLDNSYSFWTEEEINILKEKALIHHYSELPMFIPNRTEQSIVKKARELNIDLITYNVKLNNKEIERFIKSNWNKMTKFEMVRKLNVSLSVINRYQKKLGLKSSHNKKWTKEKINLLKEDAKTLNSQELAIKYNSTVNSIKSIARDNKIKLIRRSNYGVINYNRWSNEEESLLIDMWDRYSVDTISKKLNRSVSSIREKAARLNLGSPNEVIGLKISEIAEVFGISRAVIDTYWIALGLKYKTKYISKYSSFRYVEIEDLFNFLKDNQNLFDGRKLEKNILGEEPEWLIQKRKKDYFEGYKEEYLKYTKAQLLQNKKHLLEQKELLNNNVKKLKK